MKWRAKMTDEINNDQYTQIYKSIFNSLKNDKLEEKFAITMAKKLTDSVWQICLFLGRESKSYQNTIENIKEIIKNSLDNNTYDLHENADWFIN